MTNYLLMIYPALLILVTFRKCRVAGRQSFNENMWSRQQTKMLQAVSCVGVILHHLTQLITSYGQIHKGPITVLNACGILFTSVFFFSSGFGLIVSVNSRDDYLNHFLRHRLGVILVPFYVVNIINVLVWFFYLRIPMTGADIIRCLAGINLLNGNGWYIVEIFLLYIAFYILFRFIKNKDIATGLLCLVAILFIIIGLKSGHDYESLGDRWFKGEWWYNSTIVFIMGVLTARFKEPVVAFAKKHYRLLTILTAIMFFAAFAVEEYVRNVFGYYRESFTIDRINNSLITLIAQMILCLISTWLVLLINMKVSIGNRLLESIGLVSTEVFLIHGIFVRGIFDFSGMNSMVIFALVLICSFPAGTAIHYLCAPIIALIQKERGKRSYLSDEEKDYFTLKKEKKIRRIKISALALTILLLALGGAAKLYNVIWGEAKDFSVEKAELGAAAVGDIVHFGKTETDYLSMGKENVEWIVLKKEENRLMLISLMGLDNSVYNQKHEETEWETSDIYIKVNTEMFNDMFSKYEKEIIIPNPDSQDNMSLLTMAEAEELFENDESRQLDITNAAEKRGTNINKKSKVNNWDMKGYRSSWWWLRGETKDIKAPIVTVDGEILADNKYVNKPYGAIRPVIWLEL